MALNISDKFTSDIQGKDTFLVPVIAIGNVKPSTGGNVNWWEGAGSPKLYSTSYLNLEHAKQFSSSSVTTGRSDAKPLLLDVPHLRESIDIQNRKYKIPSISIKLSNLPFNGQRFSEFWDGLPGYECRIFWISQSARLLLPLDYIQDGDDNGGHALQIYYGKIVEYTYDEKQVTLKIEDKSQETFHKDLPLTEDYLGEGEDIPEKYKNKPYPMVYGHVDRSPCIIKYEQREGETSNYNTSFSIYADKPEADLYGVDHDQEHINSNHSSPLYVYTSDRYLRVVKGRNTDRSRFHQNQISTPDIKINSESKIEMISRFQHSAEGPGINSLSYGALEVDFLLTPNSAGAFLVDLSQETPNFFGDENNDENNFTLLEDIENQTYQDLGKIHDNNPETYVRVQRHWTASPETNIDLFPEEHEEDGAFTAFQYAGFGFNLRFPEFDFKLFKDINGNVINSVLAYFQIKHHWVLWNISGVGNHDLRMRMYVPAVYTAGQETANFLHYDYGNSGLKEEKTSDNFFAPFGSEGADDEFGTIAGAAPGSLYTPNIPHRWDDYRIPLAEDAESLISNLKIYQLTGSLDPDVEWEWKVHGAGIYYNILLDKPSEKDYYINVKGRLSGSMGNPGVQNILHSLLENELSVPDFIGIQVNNQDYGSSTSTWDFRYAFTIDKKINSKKVFEHLSSVSPYILRFNNIGEFSFTSIPSKGGGTMSAASWSEPEYSSDNHIIKESDIIKYSFNMTSREEIYTRVQVNYNWDYAKKEFRSKRILSMENFSCFNVSGESYNWDFYNIEEGDHSATTLLIDDDRGKYIRDDSTAESLCCWLLSWYGQQHLTMKVELPLKYINLEIGDVIKFNDLVGDMKPYGVDYTNIGNYYDQDYQPMYPTFLITSTDKSTKSVKIECIQLHELWSSDAPEGGVDSDGNILVLNPGSTPGCSEAILGCTAPTACNYDIEATLNDGSCIMPELYCEDPDSDGDGNFNTDFGPLQVCPDGSINAVSNEQELEWWYPEWRPYITETFAHSNYFNNIVNNCNDGCLGVVACDGVCDSGAILDNCGICTGGTTGIEYDQFMDCNYVCYPDGQEQFDQYASTIDDCGICSGGANSNNVPNADKDCAGVCFGSAVIDECGICDGDGSSCDIHFDSTFYIDYQRSAMHSGSGLNSLRYLGGDGNNPEVEDNNHIYLNFPLNQVPSSEWASLSFIQDMASAMYSGVASEPLIYIDIRPTGSTLAQENGDGSDPSQLIQQIRGTIFYVSVVIKNTLTITDNNGNLMYDSGCIDWVNTTLVLEYIKTGTVWVTHPDGQGFYYKGDLKTEEQDDGTYRHRIPFSFMNYFGGQDSVGGPDPNESQFNIFRWPNKIYEEWLGGEHPMPMPPNVIIDSLGYFGGMHTANFDLQVDTFFKIDDIDISNSSLNEDIYGSGSIVNNITFDHDLKSRTTYIHHMPLEGAADFCSAGTSECNGLGDNNNDGGIGNADILILGNLFWEHGEDAIFDSWGFYENVEWDGPNSYICRSAPLIPPFDTVTHASIMSLNALYLHGSAEDLGYC